MATEPADPVQWRQQEERELAKLRRTMRSRNTGFSAAAVALWVIAALLALALILYSSRYWHRLVSGPLKQTSVTLVAKTPGVPHSFL